MKNNEWVKIINQSYDLLLQHRIVDIVEPLTINDTGCQFKVIFILPFPNVEKLPESVTVLVKVPETYPYAPVSFYPEKGVVEGFPHQDAESRKLCLPPESEAPSDYTRLLVYVNWAKQWLFDAAQGKIVNIGDPYELPDFSCKASSAIPNCKQIYFKENESSFQLWRNRNTTFGTFEAIASILSSGLIISKFSTIQNRVISETSLADLVTTGSKKVYGRWVLLNDVRYFRHRPPQTYGELRELFSKNGIENINNLLRLSWDIENCDDYSMIMIGFPISRYFGDEPTEIHWQLLCIRNIGYTRKKIEMRKSKTLQLWKKALDLQFKNNERLFWGKSHNISEERIFARSHLSDEFRNSSISIIGCGAVGGLVANSLVRGGIRDLTLFDNDILQMGNLCRHVLNGTDVGSDKSKALGLSFVSINPFLNLSTFDIGIPLNSKTPNEAKHKLISSKLIIDCTASDSANKWLSDYADISKLLVISMFIDFYGNILTICGSSRRYSLASILTNTSDAVKSFQTRIGPEVYFRQPLKEEQVIEGIGCWHPSFPAPRHKIEILVASAIAIINKKISDKDERAFGALITYTNDNFNYNGTIAEIAWLKYYE